MDPCPRSECITTDHGITARERYLTGIRDKLAVLGQASQIGVMHTQEFEIYEE